MWRLQKLSIVRIFPNQVVHVKKATLKWALDLQMLFQGKHLKEELIKCFDLKRPTSRFLQIEYRALKKEETDSTFQSWTNPIKFTSQSILSLW